MYHRNGMHLITEVAVPGGYLKKAWDLYKGGHDLVKIQSGVDRAYKRMLDELRDAATSPGRKEQLEEMIKKNRKFKQALKMIIKLVKKLKKAKVPPKTIKLIVTQVLKRTGFVLAGAVPFIGWVVAAGGIAWLVYDIYEIVDDLPPEQKEAVLEAMEDLWEDLKDVF